MEKHAVIVHFDFAASSLDPLYDLEEQLESAIATLNPGKCGSAVSSWASLTRMVRPSGRKTCTVRKCVSTSQVNGTPARRYSSTRSQTSPYRSEGDRTSTTRIGTPSMMRGSS